MTRSKITLTCKNQIHIYLQISTTSSIVTMTNFVNREPSHVFIMIKFYCLGKSSELRIAFQTKFPCFVESGRNKCLRRWYSTVGEAWIQILSHILNSSRKVTGPFWAFFFFFFSSFSCFCFRFSLKIKILVVLICWIAEKMKCWYYNPLCTVHLQQDLAPIIIHPSSSVVPRNIRIMKILPWEGV